MGKIKAVHLCWNFHDWESIPVEDPLNVSSNSSKEHFIFHLLNLTRTFILDLIKRYLKSELSWLKYPLNQIQPIIIVVVVIIMKLIDKIMI